MIELAPTLKHDLDYDEALLCVWTCTHDNKYDWRLPTHKEYMNHDYIVGWFNDRDSWGEFPVIPVRTI